MGKRRSRPKEERTKAGTQPGVDRQPYDVISNVHAMKKGPKKKKKRGGDSKIHPAEEGEVAEGEVQDAIPMDELEDEADVAQTVLQKIKANAGGLLGSMLTISWSKLGKEAAGAGPGSKGDGDSSIISGSVVTSKSGLKVAGLEHQSSSFEIMDGPPLSPAKREPPVRKATKGSAGYGDVAKVDALHAREQQNLQGFTKKNMGLTLAQAQQGKFDLSIDMDADPLEEHNRSQNNMKSITDGWHKGEAAFDMSQSHFDDNGDKPPINLMAGSMASNETMRTTKSSKSHVTLIGSDGRKRTDDFAQERVEAKIKKGIHAKEQKKEIQAAETGSVISKGPGEMAHKTTKDSGGIDHKADMAKRKPGLEEEDSEDPSKLLLILPLRNALHELAALKVLNPTSGGANMAQTNTDVDYKNDGGKWEEPKKPVSAGGGGGGGASVASGLTLKSQEGGRGGSPLALENNRGGYAAAGAAEFGVIREKGRAVQYSRMKDHKAKIMKKLGNEMPDIEVHETAEHFIDLDAEPEETDAAHRVYLTGVGFVPPKSPPAPVQPVAPKKIVQDGPADRIRSERVDKPKYPLFS
jgi:hypothetical protein